MAITKNTEIKIEVSLDENNIPEHMNWTAEDGGISSQDTKAMLLSFWDSEAQETLKDGPLGKRHACGSNAAFFSSNISFFK